ncbi:MAG: NAD(P)H-binding protein, partial [Thermodesulfobacteriota bacterium]|nr:NAD(P)H-binding protein [Thermodesulfobacteriota bacterium]
MVKQLFFIALLFLASICWAGKTTDKSVHSTNTSKADAKKGLVLVAGATGMTGRLVGQTLLENGFHVRAFVRDVERANKLLGPKVEYVKGDVR